MDPLQPRRAPVAIACVLVAAGVAAWTVAAADAPPLVVTACVAGGTLTGVSAAAEDPTDRAFAPRYRLAGRRALVKEIKKQHAGHADEFTGTITGDLAATGLGRSVDLGKLSVRVGGAGRGEGPNAARVPETPVFEVTSFRHTDARCR